MVNTSISVQVVNRIQKLRKTAQLEPSDPVDVYYKSSGNDKNTLEQILKSQVKLFVLKDPCFRNTFLRKTGLFFTGSVYQRRTWFATCSKGNGTNRCGKFGSSTPLCCIFKFNSSNASYSTNLHPWWLHQYIFCSLIV